MKESYPNFDEMWDYNNPKETEEKFLEILKEKNDADMAYFLELETQLARTQGLQRNFEKAHAILDKVEKSFTDSMLLVRIRYMLERGRAFNSNNEKEKAISLFEEAYNLAKENQEDFHAVDAAHMLGIVFPFPENIKWNEKAKELAEQSKDLRAQKWLGALYNNIGWSYHDMGKYDEALLNFEKGLKFREKQTNKDLNKTLIAKWCIARCQRSLGKIEEAISIQLKLLKERKENNLSDSGYVYEELGELYLLKEEKEQSKLNFGKAYEILSLDIWLKANEKSRLERLLKLSN